MTVWVALLRGVNVGGHRVAMGDLRDVVAAAGADRVATYVQSGNVVFEHPQGEPAPLREVLERRFADAFGFEVPTLLRTPAELREVVAGCPFDVDDPTKVVVWFLEPEVGAGFLDPLDLEDVLPEEVAPASRHLYLHLPQGQARAKLPVELGRLRTADGARPLATARNWRTVGKVLDLAETVEQESAG